MSKFLTAKAVDAAAVTELKLPSGDVVLLRALHPMDIVAAGGNIPAPITETIARLVNRDEDDEIDDSRTPIERVRETNAAISAVVIASVLIPTEDYIKAWEQAEASKEQARKLLTVKAGPAMGDADAEKRAKEQANELLDVAERVIGEARTKIAATGVPLFVAEDATPLPEQRVITSLPWQHRLYIWNHLMSVPLDLAERFPQQDAVVEFVGDVAADGGAPL